VGLLMSFERGDDWFLGHEYLRLEGYSHNNYNCQWLLCKLNWLLHNGDDLINFPVKWIFTHCGYI